MKTKKADALTSAIKRTTQRQAYLKAAPLSNLKIGELLLCLQTPLSEAEKRKYGQQLETLLRAYYEQESKYLD